jgi:surface polysaccharide O-acyltransferase-like enzyme
MNKSSNNLKDKNNINNLNKNSRNYGIDLLRIFAMINIIVLHINLVSKELNSNYYSPRFQSIWLSETMAYWGVNGFGIISGIVGHKRHKFSNLIFIWIETFFYSTTISFYNYIKYKTLKRKKILLFLHVSFFTNN